MSAVVARLTRSGEGRARRPRSPAPGYRAADTPRARLLAAAEELICRSGAERLTATAVTAQAGISRTTFYAIFADREDCLLAVFDEVVDRLRGAMLAAYAAEDCWLDGVRQSLCELLAFLDAHPRLARFLIVGGVSGESALVARRRRTLEDLARALEANSPHLAGADDRAPYGSEALVSGAASIVHSRLLEDPVPSLIELSGSLMAVLVLPFVGEGAARGELARRGAPGGATPGPARSDAACAPAPVPRLSERSGQVLSLIAASPGISNRSLAKRAGDVDEGQISRLLLRLSGLGLIANLRLDSARRVTNAWHLTQAGCDLLASLSAERAP